MDIQPHRPQGGTNPGRPISGAPRPRPVMNDFAPRRPAGPAPLAPRPTPAPQPVAQPAMPPKPAPVQPRPVMSPAPNHPVVAPRPHQLPAQPAHQPQLQHPEPLLESGEVPKLPATTEDDIKTPKLRNRTGHAGLVGWGVFLLLAVLTLSPFLPGKILDNFPGSSASSSTGDQSLACANDIQNASSTTAYNTKLGSPLVYKYSSTITLHGTCDGKAQTAVGGHISQFNPLALVINLALAGVIAFAVAKVWAKVFGHKS